MSSLTFPLANPTTSKFHEYHLSSPNYTPYMCSWSKRLYQKLLTLKTNPPNPQRIFSRTSSMAWYCSGSTNTELVENLFKGGLIKDSRVKDAMLGVRFTSHQSHSSLPSHHVHARSNSIQFNPTLIRSNLIKGRSSPLCPITSILRLPPTNWSRRHNFRTTHARPRM